MGRGGVTGPASSLTACFLTCPSTAARRTCWRRSAWPSSSARSASSSTRRCRRPSGTKCKAAPLLPESADGRVVEPAEPSGYRRFVNRVRGLDAEERNVRGLCQLQSEHGVLQRGLCGHPAVELAVHDPLGEP